MECIDKKSQSCLPEIRLIHEQLEALSKKQAGPAATEALVQPILGDTHSPADRQKQHAQRLTYGLYHYYARHYQSSGAGSEEEEE